MDDEGSGEWVKETWRDHWFWELIAVPAIVAAIVSTICHAVIALTQ